MRTLERATAGAVVVLACITFGGSGAYSADQSSQAATAGLASGQPATCAEAGTGAVVPITPRPAQHVPGAMHAV